MSKTLKLFGVGVEVSNGDPPIPKGDGVSDDTDALQWYATRGLPCPSQGIHGNRYLVTLTITVLSKVIVGANVYFYRRRT